MTLQAPGGTTIAFGEGRRPEAATRVTLPAFDGPLALLLALIEARQLDVLTVPLGALAEAYLDAGVWTIDIAGKEYPAIASIKPLFDPANEKIKC